MKSFSSVFLLLIIFSATAFAAIAIGFYSDPKNPGKCTIKDDLVLSPGDTIKNPDADCGRIACAKGGRVEFQTCGVTAIEGCKLGDYIDKTLDYPDCCEKHVICD